MKVEAKEWNKNQKNQNRIEQNGTEQNKIKNTPECKKNVKTENEFQGRKSDFKLVFRKLTEKNVAFEKEWSF